MLFSARQYFIQCSTVSQRVVCLWSSISQRLSKLIRNAVRRLAYSTGSFASARYLARSPITSRIASAYSRPPGDGQRLLRGNSQDRAADSSQSWFSPRDVAKEGLHGRQSRIARADRVAAAGLQVREKFQYHGGREILDTELINGAPTPLCCKLKQELHCIPIRCGRMGADAPLYGEIPKKECREQRG